MAPVALEQPVGNRLPRPSRRRCWTSTAICWARSSASRPIRTASLAALVVPRRQERQKRSWSRPRPSAMTAMCWSPAATSLNAALIRQQRTACAPGVLNSRHFAPGILWPGQERASDVDLDVHERRARRRQRRKRPAQKNGRSEERPSSGRKRPGRAAASQSKIAIPRCNNMPKSPACLQVTKYNSSRQNAAEITGKICHNCPDFGYLLPLQHLCNAANAHNSV